MQTEPVPLLHRLLQSHPILVFDAQALPDYPCVNPDDTWALACEALTEDADYLPRLLDLNDLSQVDAVKVLEALGTSDVELQHPPLLLGGIQAGADLGRWALTQVTKAPDGSQHWLRWHDVRVWVHLLWIARPEQLAALVRPAHSVGWHWRGQWHQTVIPSPSGSTARSGWTPEQWQAIQAIGVINRVLAEIGAPALADLPQIARQIVAADVEAHTMTMWDMPSRVAFASHQLRWGAGFWQAAPFRPIMTAVATREATYAEAVSAQDEAFWPAVSEALTATV
jgi:hypothetical protein